MNVSVICWLFQKVCASVINVLQTVMSALYGLTSEYMGIGVSTHGLLLCSARFLGIARAAS